MILYFSATGNSEYVAKRIAQTTGDEVLDLFERLRSEDHSRLYSDNPWVIVAPTYAWQLPHIVRDWLRPAQLEGSDQIYFVLTCGTNIGGAGIYDRALTQEIGLEYRGTAGIVMPENYIAMFNTPDQDQALQIVDRAEDKIDQVGRSIQEGRWLEELGGGHIQSMIMNWGFHRFIIGDRKFESGPDCTSCGQCARVCPTENIYLDEKTRTPVWAGRCIHCMACINRCPFHAIEYGSSTKNRERYRCPKSLGNI